MKRIDAIRALKDRSYRNGLSEQQKVAVVDPAGVSELDESLLDFVSGAGQSNNGCLPGGGTTFHYACQK